MSIRSYRPECRHDLGNRIRDLGSDRFTGAPRNGRIEANNA
jgi:hypothetical protein